MSVHMIFDVKLDTEFTLKARLVTEYGHKVYTSLSMTYISVVSWYSVHINLMLYSFNGLDILCNDVKNEYHNAKIKEKLWFLAGDKFYNQNRKAYFILLEYQEIYIGGFNPSYDAILRFLSL